jgi:DNA-binding IclR family transcriptional regulator
MRIQLLQELRNKEAPVHEIAKATGLSISYVRKIKKN